MYLYTIKGMTSLPWNNDPELASGATASEIKTIINQLSGSGPSCVSLPPRPQKQQLQLALQQNPAPETLEKSSESLDLERCITFDSKIKYSATRKMGVVRLRLARFGRKNAPFYRIHAADSRSPRDGKFLERIGYYDPRPGKDGHKRIAINFERAKYWLSVGAQPSDVVRRIFFIAGLLPRPPVPQTPKKGSYSKGNEGVGLAGILDGEEDDIDEDDLEGHAELV